MRALALLVLPGLFTGCDRVFGLGDPYEDARTAGGSDAHGDGTRAIDGSDGRAATLLAYYPLDGNLADMTGRAAATCSGQCSYATSRTGVGGSLHMDGSTSCLTFTLPDQPNEVSIAMWAFPDTGAGEPLVVRTFSISTPALDSWRLDEDNDSMQWTTYNGSSSNVVNGGAANIFQAGQWHHAAVVSTTAKDDIYIDGSVMITGAGATIAYGGDMTVYIGCDAFAGPGGKFAGEVDEIRVYDGALTQDEITALAQ